jgi:hypothetical protein
VVAGRVRGAEAAVRPRLGAVDPGRRAGRAESVRARGFEGTTAISSPTTLGKEPEMDSKRGVASRWERIWSKMGEVTGASEGCGLEKSGT